ncbi:RHS repeat domain-containing protein [Niabella sp. 22666]|uniref:RHS repeat domain-containing protein n=1 Tax=Niabella sp. 22666 TaxID=3453954 RepID=UPI003F8554BE
MIFENNVLQHVATDEGRARLEAGAWKFDYFFKDHLGNTRLVVGQAGTMLQETDYYPFGLAIQRSQSVPNKYLYNGKELQDELGLGQYDYGARFYDPAIGRWHVSDLLQEDEYWDDDDLGKSITPENSAVHYNTSPYNYVLNDPINLSDPYGLDTIPPARMPIIPQFSPTPQPVNVILYDPSKAASQASSSGNPAVVVLEAAVIIGRIPKLPPVAYLAAGIAATFWALAQDHTVPIGGTWGSFAARDNTNRRFDVFTPVKQPGTDAIIKKFAEHTKGARPSTKGKHEKGQTRKEKQRGGYKGQKGFPRKRPKDYEGKWPPK